MKTCENCKWWKCMGFHYYERTNKWSEHYGEQMSRCDKCVELEED